MGTRVFLPGVVEITAEHPGPACSALTAEVAFLVHAQSFTAPNHLCEALLRWLLLPPTPHSNRPAISQATVSLLTDEPVHRTAMASAQQYPQEHNPWGSVDIIAEWSDVGLYRLNIDPHQSIPHHVHRHMDEQEFVLTDGLIGWNDPNPPQVLRHGAHWKWPRLLAHGYHNPLSQIASVLCIDQPRFDPADEVIVPGGPTPEMLAELS